MFLWFFIGGVGGGAVFGEVGEFGGHGLGLLVCWLFDGCWWVVGCGLLWLWEVVGFAVSSRRYLLVLSPFINFSTESLKVEL